MDFDQQSYVIATYPSYETAILTFDRLILTGFSPANISIVSKGLTQRLYCGDPIQIAQTTKQSSAKVFASGDTLWKVGWRIGSILGGAIGILLGHSVSSLPGVDGIMLLSKIIFALASGFVCCVSGGIVGTSIIWQISQGQIREWNQCLTQGDYLLVMFGSTDEIARAKRFLIASLQEKVASEY